MKKIIYITLFVVLLVPAFVGAEDKYTLLEPLPCVQGTGVSCDTSPTVSEISLDTYIGYIFKFAIAISAFLAVVVIIWGGFEVMLSEVVSTKMEGKARIQNALLGLLMVLSSYLILRTIDPRLVEINSSIPEIKPASNAWLQDTSTSTLNYGLEKINKESLINNAQFQQKGVALQKELSDLNARLDRKEISQTEYNIEKSKIESQLKQNTASALKEDSTATISKLFLDTINDTNAINSTYTNTANQIKSISSEKISALTALGDLEGAQKIEFMRDFFSSQITEQSKFDNGLAYGNPGEKITKFNEAKAKYVKMTSSSQELSEEEKRIKSDPVLSSIYVKMLENRMGKIRTALGPSYSGLTK